MPATTYRGLPAEIRLIIWRYALEDLPREIIVFRNESSRIQIRFEKRVNNQELQDTPGVHPLAVLQLNRETRNEASELLKACIVLDLSRLEILDAIMCLETLPTLSLRLIEDVIIRITPRDAQDSSSRVERVVAENLRLRRLVCVTKSCAWIQTPTERNDLQDLCGSPGRAAQLPLQNLVVKEHIKEGCLYITCDASQEGRAHIQALITRSRNSVTTDDCRFAALKLYRRDHFPHASDNQHDDMMYHMVRDKCPGTDLWVLTVNKTGLTKATDIE